jgi:hypothetical protein
MLCWRFLVFTWSASNSRLKRADRDRRFRETKSVDVKHLINMIVQNRSVNNA